MTPESSGADAVVALPRIATTPESSGADAAVAMPALLAQLGRLLTDLGRCRVLDDSLGAYPEGLEAWADEEHLYLEARLPHSLEASIDISALDRKLFVRLAWPPS